MADNIDKSKSGFPDPKATHGPGIPVLNFLRKEGTVIKGAPFSFFGCLLVFSAAIYLYEEHSYSIIIRSKDAIIESYANASKKSGEPEANSRVQLTAPNGIATNNQSGGVNSLTVVNPEHTPAQKFLKWLEGINPKLQSDPLLKEKVIQAVENSKTTPRKITIYMKATSPQVETLNSIVNESPTGQIIVTDQSKNNSNIIIQNEGKIDDIIIEIAPEFFLQTLPIKQ